MGEVNALAEKLNCQVVPADATSVEDLSNVFKTSMDVLGGQIDFVLHSIGMSPNVRKKRSKSDRIHLKTFYLLMILMRNVLCPTQQSGNFVRMPTTPGHSILGVWMVTKM